MTDSCDACGGDALEWRGGNGVCMSCGTVCEGSAIVPDPDRTSELAANFFKPKEPNAPDEHGVPPLHRAVRAGFEAEVAELVAFRANVNARDALGQTALQLAIEEGHAGIADLLIEAGADVDAQTTTVMPRTVMTEKSWGGPRRTEMTTILDYLEETVLMLAIKRRRLEIVDKLIKAGADVDADDCHGETALTLAVKDGLLGIVDKLIEAGADNLSLFDCDDLLHRAIDDGCERQVLVLLRAGADVEIEESGEGTPLSYAARLGETSMVSLLLEYGADVDHDGGWCGTALQIVMEQGDSEIFELLVGAGADTGCLEDPDEDGLRPLYHAAQSGNERMVLALLRAGAVVNVRGGEWSWLPPPPSALGAAAQQGHMGIVVMLLDAGADDLDEAYKGALRKGHARILGVLRRHGAPGDPGSILRTDSNASAWRYHDKLVEAGGYHAFLARHRRVLSQLLQTKFFEADRKSVV